MTAPSSTSSSPSPMNRRPKSWARRCERACCSVVTYLPLAFIYGLSTWAIWVEAGIGFSTGLNRWTSKHTPPFPFRPYLALKSRNRRHTLLHYRHHPLPPSKLVIHYSCLHRSGIASQRDWQYRILSPTHPRAVCAPRCSIFHCQVYGRDPFLQKM